MHCTTKALSVYLFINEANLGPNLYWARCAQDGPDQDGPVLTRPSRLPTTWLKTPAFQISFSSIASTSSWLQAETSSSKIRKHEFTLFGVLDFWNGLIHPFNTHSTEQCRCRGDSWWIGNPSAAETHHHPHTDHHIAYTSPHRIYRTRSYILPRQLLRIQFLSYFIGRIECGILHLGRDLCTPPLILRKFKLYFEQIYIPQEY